MGEVDVTLKPEEMDDEVRHVYDKIMPVYNRCGHETQSILHWLFCTWQVERNACRAMAMELQKHVLFQEAVQEEVKAEELAEQKRLLNADEPTIEPHSNS